MYAVMPHFNADEGHFNPDERHFNADECLGIYITCSAAMTAVSLGMMVAWKKDYLSLIRNFGAIFALVWYIHGWIILYKVKRIPTPFQPHSDPIPTPFNPIRGGCR